MDPRRVRAIDIILLEIFHSHPLRLQEWIDRTLAESFLDHVERNRVKFGISFDAKCDQLILESEFGAKALNFLPCIVGNQLYAPQFFTLPRQLRRRGNITRLRLRHGWSGKKHRP